MNKLKLLDLFSGIGGFSLGLERTGGFETVAFCEIEEFPRRVLAKHWPEVPQYEDIRDLTASRLRDDGISVDAICGGFPCQDISTAGKGAGIEGERSGLWSEYARLIGELRPQVVFVENVAALLGRGLDRVLGDLAALGYDAEWHCIPASAVGAPHRRDRVWIVAYPSSIGWPILEDAGALSAGKVYERQKWHPEKQVGELASLASKCAVAHPVRERSQGSGRTIHAGRPTPEIYREVNRAIHDCRWSSEPNVGRVAHGVPHRVDRLKGLGNAVVPQIPELIGNAYLESIGWRAAA
jgi:DNA (cytosine-5)-methyltransferase 1